MEHDKYIERLKQVIFHRHQTDSEFAYSTPVREIFQGKTMWVGIVEVFNLKHHPEARRCYAWNHGEGTEDNQEILIVVLEIPPNISPETAVNGVIRTQMKEKKK